MDTQTDQLLQLVRSYIQSLSVFVRRLSKVQFAKFRRPGQIGKLSTLLWVANLALETQSATFPYAQLFDLLCALERTRTVRVIITRL
jgi:hypothetical protein